MIWKNETKVEIFIFFIKIPAAYLEKTRDQHKHFIQTVKQLIIGASLAATGSLDIAVKLNVTTCLVMGRSVHNLPMKIHPHETPKQRQSIIFNMLYVFYVYLHEMLQQ